MKFFLIIAISVSFAFISCSKEKEDHNNWGELNALKNGVPWGGIPLCIINKPHNLGLDINVRTYSDKGYARESLTFFKIPDAVGAYALSPTDYDLTDSLHGLSYATRIDDGDVIGAFYDLLEGVIENKVVVNRKEGNELWGEFQAAIVKNTLFGNDPTAPDTIIFTNGSFHVRISK